MKYTEPADGTTLAFLHPRTREPERMFHRDDAVSIESGYGEDDEGRLTGQHWYEVVEFPEAPITWDNLEEMADGGPIAVVGLTELTEDPMPVFVIKAKDEFAVSAVSAYRRLCEARGLDDQAAQVRLAAAEMSAWRERNPGAVKLPDHPHIPVART
jgi:hypothetical protein